MTARSIVIVNQGNVPVVEINNFVLAMEEYLGKWYAAFWPETMGTTIRIAGAGPVPVGSAPLVLAPTTTQAGSLGYHVKTPDGQPTAIVELDACRNYNWPWTIAASHELEMLINPNMDRYARSGDKFYPIEVADAVSFHRGWRIGFVEVSNFTTPAYWGLTDNTRYDALARVTNPLPVIPAKGWLMSSSNGSWASAYGAELAPDHLAYLSGHQGRSKQIAQFADHPGS